MSRAAVQDIHRFIFETSSQLRNAGDPDKVLRHYLRATVDFMQADSGYVATLGVGDEMARSVFAQPAGAPVNLALVTDLLRGRQSGIPAGTLCARISRRGRPWGMMVLERSNYAFPAGSPRGLAHIARVVTETIERLDRERLSEVRGRIDDMILRELPPKDLYYQILDGLHQLTRYDHSAALWIWSGPGLLELVAEQIAWKKLKSPIIGQTVQLPIELQPILQDGVVYGFDRSPHGWTEWTPHQLSELAEFLDLDREHSERPREQSMLCASVGGRDGPLGILKLSACAPGTFGLHELAIVQNFMSLASVALKRAQTLEDLQARMLKIERQNALAHLARGVAHDINNALGEVIPLVQQIQADVQSGTVVPDVLTEDLHRVELSLQVTRGIFGRMLRFARGSARNLGPSDLHGAFEAVRDVLQESLTRLHIRVHAELPDQLIAVQCSQSDLERLLFNLMTNGRDALPNGGTLTVAGRMNGSSIEITVSDDGIGMTPEALAEIESPFFTTKEHGTGLGLSTCRSIAAEAGGSLTIESRIGEGTRVTASLSAVQDGTTSD
jgi:nitrogen-specific signal transduction histidine kinase